MDKDIAKVVTSIIVALTGVLFGLVLVSICRIIVLLYYKFIDGRVTNAENNLSPTAIPLRHVHDGHTNEAD